MTDATRDWLLDMARSECEMTKGLNEYYKDIIDKYEAVLVANGYDPEKIKKEPAESFDSAGQKE